MAYRRDEFGHRVRRPGALGAGTLRTMSSAARRHRRGVIGDHWCWRRRMMSPSRSTLSRPHRKYKHVTTVSYRGLPLTLRLPPGGGAMPRKSPYVLELTAEQRHELQARSRRYTLPYRDVHASQDCAHGRRRPRQRRDRCPSRHAPRDRVEMAQTLLRARPARPRRTSPRRPTPGLSP